jgi:hypothetical protein
MSENKALIDTKGEKESFLAKKKNYVIHIKQGKRRLVKLFEKKLKNGCYPHTHSYQVSVPFAIPSPRCQGSLPLPFSHSQSCEEGC